MVCPSKLYLRILYTINSSPQYILARSHSAIPVNLISQPELDAKQHPTRLKFATVSLKACLDTICRSSPELIQDNNRDYSVYVLDPLESGTAPAPMNISNSSNSSASTKAQDRKLEQPCGVAVGLGLMSWALHADENDGAVVTGTQVRLGTGQGALEVIFALRETAAMQRASLSTTMQSWALPLGRSSSIQPAPMATPSTTVDPNMLQLTDPAVKQVHCASDAAAISPTASKTLAAIRARNKAKSRPKKVPKPSTTPTTESDKLMYASETYIGPLKKKGRPKNPCIGPEISKNHNSDFQSPPETKQVAQNFPAACNSASENKKMQSPLPDSTVVATQAHNYNSFIELLASISNPSASNAALLATLSTIDAPSSAQQNLTNQEPSPLLANALGQLLSTFMNQTSQNSSQQPSDSSRPVRGSIIASQDEDVVILDKENVDPLAFRRRGDKDLLDPKGNSNNVAQSTISGTPPVDSGNPIHSVLSQRNEQTNTTTMRRKRTLSDFMDEKESERNKQRERERTERRELHRQSQSQIRRTSGSNTIYDRDPNDLRHYPRLAGEALPRPGMNSYYRASLETRSSPPPRPRSNANIYTSLIDSPTSRRRGTKGPASSPTRPNLGGPSRKGYIVPEWARTNTATQPRLSEEAQRALAEAEEVKKKEREASRRKTSLSYRRLRQESRTEVKAKQKPSPDAPKSDPPPPVAVKDACPVFAASDTSTDFFSSLSPSSPPRSPRFSLSSHIPQTPPQKCSMRLFTPDNGSSSLFTPTPKAKNTGRPGGIPNSLGCSPSPSTRSGVIEMSPIQAVVSGRSIGGADGWSGKARKYDNGWDEVDGPPSSLPTASDGEDDVPTSSSFSVEEKSSNIEAERDEQEVSVKQHWAGLPPSSPPPPSSPTLTPQDQDDDMELTDLPVPTSDIEDSMSPSFQEPDGDEGAGTAIFDPLLCALSSDGAGPSDMDIFAQLSSDFHGRDGSNIPIMDPILGPILQNGLADFDFTEFWESFKPIVQDHANAPDSNKLAEDIQALFGGCLM